MDWFWIIIAIVAIFVIWYLWKSNNEATTTSTTTTATARTQMVEDIKSTQTSRVSDVAEIMDELSQTSSNYRHYCELIGTSMDKGVIAPYSQREVAYYDIRCYRVDYRGGQEVETLVAHETSIDPFYFKDASSDKPVYVDLASFGGNVILVNSTNHIEGPNSEFSKKLGEKITSATSGSYSTACTASVPERLNNVLRGVADALDRVLLPGGAPAFGLVAAGAVAGGMGPNVLFAQGGHSGKVHNMGNRPQMPSGGQMPRGGQAPSGRQMPGGGQMPRGTGGYSSMGMGNLDSFLGQGMGGSFSYGGGGRYYGGGYVGSDLGTTLLNVGLGALLSSMYSTSSTTTKTTTTTPQSTFRGYRLVEDVVPLNSPIYCIGEVYLHGTSLYIGKSTDSDYTTSFFATKPESEVVAHLKS